LQENYLYLVNRIAYRVSRKEKEKSMHEE